MVDISDSFSPTISGASSGASLGSIIPGVGTGVGAVVGGAVGFISGLFGSSSRKRAERRRRSAAIRQETLRRKRLILQANLDDEVITYNYNKALRDENRLYAAQANFYAKNNLSNTGSSFRNISTSSTKLKNDARFKYLTGKKRTNLLRKGIDIHSQNIKSIKQDYKERSTANTVGNILNTVQLSGRIANIIKNSS